MTTEEASQPTTRCERPSCVQWQRLGTDLLAALTAIQDHPERAKEIADSALADYWDEASHVSQP